MSFLLMFFLTLVCMFEGYPAPLWGGGPLLALSLTLASTALLGGRAAWVTWRFCRAIRDSAVDRELLLARYDRQRLSHQLLQLGLYVLTLVVFGWGWMIHQEWQHHGLSLPGREVLLLLPFVVGQMLSWAFFYDADREAHRMANAPLADPFGSACLELPQSANTPFGGRFSYVLFNLRQKLALVFIPILLLVLRADLSRLLPTQPDWQPLMQVLGVAGLLAAFVFMPLLIRLLLGLQPLPRGPMRDRLQAAAQRLGIRCSGILLWNTRSGMANAMVLGLVPWLRYIVFTDRLLEEFSADEVEAVFGHEAGHVRHWHMPFYLLFLTASMAVLGLVVDFYILPALSAMGLALHAWWPDLFGEYLVAQVGTEGKLALFPVFGLMLGYIFLVFGFLSRRCERQADVYGCRAVSCRDPNCQGHDDTVEYARGGTCLCPTGVRTFIRALDKVAQVNGISRERPGFLQSWQHSTIARRVMFLRGLLCDQLAEPRFQRRLGWIKWGLLLGLGVSLALLVALHGWQ